MLYSKRKINLFYKKTFLFLSLIGAASVLFVSCSDELNKFSGGTEEEFKEFARQSDKFEDFEGVDINKFSNVFDNVDSEKENKGR